MFIKSMVRISFALLAASLMALAQNQPIVIKAGTLLDGKGGVQKNVSIVVVGSKIEKLDPGAKPTYDLHNLTVLPGMIDTHVHIGWHFGPDGRYQPRDDSQTAAMGYAMENAYVTLMGGFTTVQSVGSPIDGDVRTAINRGVAPGPRVLTSLRAINNPAMTPDQIREAVRKMKADGSDLVKMFASKSFRDGGERRSTRSRSKRVAARPKRRVYARWCTCMGRRQSWRCPTRGVRPLSTAR